ncbi:MAG: hypothetical protein L0312_20025 [Acidobacteria bacterium]|nr:hypothetical protein [Acidobacteriota bacterium]
MPSWHHANLRLAAALLNRHQDDVGGIHWDIAVEGDVRWYHRWYRRNYRSASGRLRYVFHEAFFPGQVVGIHCAVPATISNGDVGRLMQLAGQYRGLSPWKPGEYGFFDVERVGPRRAQEDDHRGPIVERVEQALRQSDRVI